MNIWILEISDFLPGLDGDNRLYRAGLLAKALVGAGHTVLWWSSTFNHQRRRQRFDSSVTVEMSDNYRLRLLHGPGYKRSVSYARIRHNRAVAREFALEVESIVDEKPDVIYACLPTLEVCEQAILYGAKHQVPVVVDVREIWPDAYLTIFPLWLRPMFKLLLRGEFSRARRILGRATAILSTSATYLNWGLRIAGRRPGPSDKWFALGADIDENLLSDGHLQSLQLPNGMVLEKRFFYITYVGTFTSHINYRTIIQVARELSKRGRKDVHFLFVGDGDHRQAIEKGAKGLDNFHVTGWCEKALVYKILGISSVAIAPYFFPYDTTLSNKPFEYMAAGLPIITSLKGELKSIIESESIGFHYPADNPKVLMDRIDWLLAQPEERKAMGRRGRRLFEQRYNAGQVYQDFAQHLVSIAKGTE